MKFAPILCLIGFALCPLVSVAQVMNWTEDSWEELVDEPSRGELLRQHMPPEIEAVPRNFKFPEDTLNPPAPRVFGIDISHYSPANLPFDKFAEKNIHYVYIKATQGTNFKDGKFPHFWSSIGALTGNKKVARGAYHFLSASTSSDPELQAERFVAYVNLHGGFHSDDMPPVMDWEWDKASASSPDRWAALTPAQIVAKALKFLKRVEDLTGRVPMIYVSRAWWRERGILDSEIAKFSRYKLWIPDYSTATLGNENPRGPNNVVPHLWQFTDRSRITGGPAANLDGNMFKGTLNDFRGTFLFER